MARFSIGVPETDEINQLHFMCPGCDEMHALNTTWAFNGDLDRPTVSPSILVRRPANPDASEEFIEYRKESVCHSFIREGHIHFLPDCTHQMAGRTVELPHII